MDLQTLIVLIIELIGTSAFSISGAMVGIRRKMDIFGVLVLGVVTAVGGGMMRDVILGKTPSTNTPKISIFRRIPTIAPEIENAIVPINSMTKTINVCKSILFLPHFYTDISTNISSFCLKFYHKGFAFSIMLHMF